MNVRAPIALPHPTIEDMWTVPWMNDERTIVRENGMFKALFCGGMLRWCRELAVRDAVEDIEHHADLHARAVALQQANRNRFAALSAAQFDRILADREQELAGVSVNSPGRADMLREDIQSMKDSRARQLKEEAL